MQSTLPATLAAYSDDELAEFYNNSPDAGQWHAILEAEMNRRDAADREVRQASDAAKRARQAEYRVSGPGGAWYEAAHAQFLEAEAACRGHLLSAAGMAETSNPMTLWTGTEKWARRLASEELNEWWDTHPRLTITEYNRQAAGEHRAWIERHDRETGNDQLDRHAAGALRQVASQGQGARVRGDGRGEHVPGLAARGRAQDHAGAGAAARPGGPVRGGGRVTGDERSNREIAAERAARIRALAASGGPLAGDEGRESATAAGSGYGGSGGALALRSGGGMSRGRQPQIDGAQALDYARQFLAHFAVWPSEAALTAATLWAGHCHGRDAAKALVFMSSPRLLFSSAEPGSGKSHAMKLVSRICPDPVIFTEPSEPAMAHSIGEHQTIGLEEVDVFFGTGNRKAAVRAIINDGYTPDGQWARVRNGQTHRICTFGPLMMAGLDKVESGTSGTLSATLSRCIRVKMRRAPDDYRPPRWDYQARTAAGLISERLTQWASQNLDALASYVPDLDGIGNRQAELWEPLAIVADIAGGPWPDMLRDAADELITTGGMPPEDEDRGAELHAIVASWGTGEDEF